MGPAQAQEWYREDLVGQAIIESGVPREQLFLTSKLHPRYHGYDAAMIQVRHFTLQDSIISASSCCKPVKGCTQHGNNACQMLLWSHRRAISFSDGC